LKAVSLGRQHGWAISERISQVSGDMLRIAQGSLYPALHRLHRSRWRQAHWAPSEQKPRPTFYGRTSRGSLSLERARRAWRRLGLGANAAMFGIVDRLLFRSSGILIGGAIALGAGRWVQPLVFAESPKDPVVFGAVTAVLLSVAAAASVLPAMRASRVDPNVALRAE